MMQILQRWLGSDSDGSSIKERNMGQFSRVGWGLGVGGEGTTQTRDSELPHEREEMIKGDLAKRQRKTPEKKQNGSTDNVEERGMGRGGAGGKGRWASQGERKKVRGGARKGEPRGM